MGYQRLLTNKPFLNVTLCFLLVLVVVLLICGLSVSLSEQRMSDATMKRVILDVDVGTDDTMAILIFLYAMKLGILKVEGIVCTNGNTHRETVVKNVVRILELTGRTDIPVYRGAAKPLMPSDKKLDRYHGKDGFGDLNHDNEPDISIVNDTPGAIAMYELVKKNPKQITIIGAAALTNIALASRLYDDFLDNVKDIWLMGGNYKGIGNTEGTAEFNFYADPEAAYLLINEARPTTPITMVPWETCISSTIPRSWRFDVLGKSKLPIMQLLTEAERNVHKPTETHWACSDGQMAASYVFPDRAILSANDYSISVELHGSQTRGQVTVYSLKKRAPNVRIVEKIDYEFYQKLLMNVAELSETLE